MFVYKFGCSAEMGVGKSKKTKQNNDKKEEQAYWQMEILPEDSNIVNQHLRPYPLFEWPLAIYHTFTVCFADVGVKVFIFAKSIDY